MLVNRAPVLVLWAAIVAERLGYCRDEALSLAKGVAGLTAQAKGQSLRIYRKELKKRRKPDRAGEQVAVELLGRMVPAVETPDGMRALTSGRPIAPESVEKYLEQKFGESLNLVRRAMVKLARVLPPGRLEKMAFALYLDFRPEVPAGAAGWGAKGRLDLDRIAALAEKQLNDTEEAGFAEGVAAAVARIPPGRVATYGQIAALAGNPHGAREVVRVLRSVAGLPWHRVVGKGGRISLPGEAGLMQRQKLVEEGVEFNPDGTVTMDVCRWQPG